VKRRKIDVNDSIRKNEYIQTTKTTNEYKKTTQKFVEKKVHIPILRKSIHSSEYGEKDLRRLFQQATKNNYSPYEVLLENGHIDDMIFWEEGDVT
jgi:hypothetical protein